MNDSPPTCRRDPKLLPALAVSLATTWVTLVTRADLTSLAIGDMVEEPNTNYIMGIEDAAALAASNFTADASAPVCVSFDLDLDDGVLTLLFSEPIQAATLDVTRLTLFSSRGEGVDAEYSEVGLTSSSTTSSADGVTLDVDLSLADLAAIKARRFFVLFYFIYFILYFRIRNGGVEGHKDRSVSPRRVKQLTRVICGRLAAKRGEIMR